MEITPLGFKKPVSSDSADLRVFIGTNMDLLDILISRKEKEIPKQSTPPTSPKTYDLWIDTTSEPYSLKMFSGSLWVLVGGSGSGGASGKSAYQVWLDLGNTGTPQQFIDSLKGAQGIQGAIGSQGIQGQKGDQGIQGLKGDQGIQGIQGLKGDQGIQGAAGSGGSSTGTIQGFDKFVIKDSWNTSGVHSTPSNMDTFYIINTGTTDLTFNINGITQNIKANEELLDIFDQFSQVTISATGTFEAKVGSAIVSPTSSVKDAFSGSANVTRTISGSIVGISNDGTSPLTLVVNGISNTIVAGDVKEFLFAPFTQITVNSTIPFRAYVKGVPAAIDTTPPNPITGLMAGTATTSTIPISWTVSNSGDVVNQEVAYSLNGGTSYTIVSSAINPSSSSYIVTGLSANQSYTIRVIAIDGAGNRSTGVTVDKSTLASTDTTPPEVVTNLAVGTPTSTSVPLTWTASIASDIANYEVAFSTDGTNYTISSASVTGTSYTVTGLTASTLYTFRVASIDTSNNRSSGNPTVQATTTTPASGTVQVFDDFNRSDGTVGNAVTGQVWNGGGGSLAPTIMSNQIGFTANSTNYPNFSISLSDNVDIEMDLILPTLTTGNISGVSARVNAGNNQGLIFGALSNGTRAGFLSTLTGAATVPATASFTFNTGQAYRLKLEVRGNVYKGYIDGVLIQSYTDTANIGLSNTKYGFVFYNTAVPRGDNFKITSH
ncbi:hypothetical protein BC351_10640 [Paenibacillus ferrarius]|uniref:Fibronectin type-III domain-containing protein n=1 Tax=Paenibacillus ferrarius TaxID=1469647 RepID=A0A1V4H8Z3_9BACL|nr:fibronectin type III domain-containing protein [Paenibacillus ferrarius]OPH47638.1 hypothetical protein BC351_10640 [Paenibacillus ferrarius]